MEDKQKRSELDFKKAKPGDKVRYQGFTFTVKENNGAILVLSGENGREVKVNMPMFIQRLGMIVEGDTSEYEPPQFVVKPQDGDKGYALVKKNYKRNTLKNLLGIEQFVKKR